MSTVVAASAQPSSRYESDSDERDMIRLLLTVMKHGRGWSFPKTYLMHMRQLVEREDSLLNCCAPCNEFLFNFVPEKNVLVIKNPVGVVEECLQDVRANVRYSKSGSYCLVWW